MAVEAAGILQHRRNFIPCRKACGLVAGWRGCNPRGARGRDCNADHSKDECDCEGYASNGEFIDSHRRLHAYVTTRVLQRESHRADKTLSRAWMPGINQRFHRCREVSGTER